MACGNDEIMSESISVGTGVIVTAESGCNTARVMTKNVMIDTTVKTQDMSSQARTTVCDTGCDGIITEMQSQAS